MTQLTVVNIPEANLPSLELTLVRLNKKAAKAGMPDIKLTELGTTTEKDGKGSVTVFRQIAIEAETIIHGDWKVAARIDHNDDPSGAKNLVYNAPGEPCPREYYHAGANCDHCGWTRKRRDTFILVNEKTDEYKQIGRTCVQEFTGGLNPNAVIKQLERLGNFIEQANEASKNVPLADRRKIDLTIFLAYVNMSMRELGWTSMKEAREHGDTTVSTRDQALHAMFSEYSDQPTQDDFDHAEAAMDWVKTLDPDRDEFTHNIHTLCTDGYGDYKAAGIAASIVWMYDKHLAREAKKALPSSSEYLGEIGKHITGEVTVTGNDVRDGTYGTYNLVTMKSNDGATIVTMGRFDPGKVGTRFKLKAKVKDHTEFRGEKQTHVNYCKKI